MTEHSQRPWGSYRVLTEGDSFKVKTIEVHPGQRLSYQKHARRAEHWFVVTGQGTVTLDGVAVPVKRGSTVDVGLVSRTACTTPAPSRSCSSKSSTGTTSVRTTSSGSRTTTAVASPPGSDHAPGPALPTLCWRVFG